MTMFDIGVQRGKGLEPPAACVGPAQESVSDREFRA